MIYLFAYLALAALTCGMTIMLTDMDRRCVAFVAVFWPAIVVCAAAAMLSMFMLVLLLIAGVAVIGTVRMFIKEDYDDGTFQPESTQPDVWHRKG